MAEENAQASKKGYWETFYAKASLALSPSTFAQHVVDRGYVKAGDSLVDIGCGNGRDSLHFASQGVHVLGIDASTAAIEILNAHNHPNATFRAVDIKEEAFLGLSSHQHFYMRFLLHAVTPSEEDRIFSVLAAAPNAARVILEFRTVNDPLMDKGEVLSPTERSFGHYRRFLDVEKVVAKLAGIGFKRVLLKSEEGNLSIAGDDNPVLGRIIADKA